MERIVVTDLLDYLRVNNIISNHQHGFLSGKSTCTKLLETLNDWTLAIKNRRSVTVACIDYQKAFDAASHNKLLAKLESYGTEGNIREWIRNFLNNRNQQIGTFGCWQSFQRRCSGQCDRPTVILAVH